MKLWEVENEIGNIFAAVKLNMMTLEAAEKMVMELIRKIKK